MYCFLLSGHWPQEMTCCNAPSCSSMLMDEEFIIDQAKTGQLTQAIGHESGQKNQYWLTEQLQSKKFVFDNISAQSEVHGHSTQLTAGLETGTECVAVQQFVGEVSGGGQLLWLYSGCTLYTWSRHNLRISVSRVHVSSFLVKGPDHLQLSVAMRHFPTLFIHSVTCHAA